jgi:hypothetical protein
VNRGKDPLDRLVRVVEQAGGDDDVRATTFVRGLALGALVGAAIAGSTIWQRRRHLETTSSTGKAPAAEEERSLPGE